MRASYKPALQTLRCCSGFSGTCFSKLMCMPNALMCRSTSASSELENYDPMFEEAYEAETTSPPGAQTHPHPKNNHR